MITVRIVEEPIRTSEARDAVAAPENGAVLVFEGLVRNHHQGRRVSGIEYHAYQEMALAELRRISEEVAENHGIGDLSVIHRTGPLRVGEASLVVAVGSPHREPAFRAAMALIDELKRRVPIWKKEWGPDGTSWVEGVRPAPGD